MSETTIPPIEEREESSRRAVTESLKLAQHPPPVRKTLPMLLDEIVARVHALESLTARLEAIERAFTERGSWMLDRFVALESRVRSIEERFAPPPSS